MTSPVPSPTKHKPAALRFSPYSRETQGGSPCRRTHLAAPLRPTKAQAAARHEKAAEEPIAFDLTAASIEEGDFLNRALDFTGRARPPEAPTKVRAMRRLQGQDSPAAAAAAPVLQTGAKPTRSPMALNFDQVASSANGAAAAASAGGVRAFSPLGQGASLCTPTRPFSLDFARSGATADAQELSFDDDSSSFGTSFSTDASDLSWLSSPDSRASRSSPPSPLALHEESGVPMAPDCGAPSVDVFMSYGITKTEQLPSGHTLVFLASGEHQNVYTLTPGQPSLIAGVDNNTLVIKVFKTPAVDSAAYKRLYKGLYSRDQAKSYQLVKDVVTNDYRFAKVYNNPVQDGFSICEKIPHDPRAVEALVRVAKAAQTEEQLLTLAPQMKKLQALFTYALKLAMGGKILDLAKLDNVALEGAGRLVVMDLYELGDEDMSGALTHLRRGLKAFAGTVYVNSAEVKPNPVVYAYLVKEFLKFVQQELEISQKLLHLQMSEIKAGLKALGVEWSIPEGTTFAKKMRVAQLNSLVPANAKEIKGKVNEYCNTLTVLLKYEDAIGALTA